MNIIECLIKKFDKKKSLLKTNSYYNFFVEIELCNKRMRTMNEVDG